MFYKKDSLGWGLVLGFFGPIIGLIVFYFARFSRLTFLEFLQYLAIWKTLLTAVLSVSLMANAVLFTAYVNTNKDNTGKGIFLATCVYAIACLVVKYLI